MIASEVIVGSPLIQATGFDVAKIEDHLVGRLFKLAELLVYLLLGAYLGLTAKDVLLAVLNR